VSVIITIVMAAVIFLYL